MNANGMGLIGSAPQKPLLVKFYPNSAIVTKVNPHSINSFPLLYLKYNTLRAVCQAFFIG